jgi:hypothetical protein
MRRSRVRSPSAPPDTHLPTYNPVRRHSSSPISAATRADRAGRAREAAVRDAHRAHSRARATADPLHAVTRCQTHEQPIHLVGQCRAVADQALPDPMQPEHCLLLLARHGDLRYPGLSTCTSNCLGIPAVVLLSTAEGPHVLPGDQSRLMPDATKLASPMMRGPVLLFR